MAFARKLPSSWLQLAFQEAVGTQGLREPQVQAIDPVMDGRKIHVMKLEAHSWVVQQHIKRRDASLSGGMAVVAVLQDVVAAAALPSSARMLDWMVARTREQMELCFANLTVVEYPRRSMKGRPNALDAVG
eukprot:NODE_4070_length_866_cov_31.319461_g3755_i0.p2 GENE.NODE_4070_length_866_cov_31.319461_g3755_i0~~NODE_4070_length_866_cov_31.319461_g3755_i0.p2  ORF type:complete len:131 (-),score=22.84 NODE_4070_length_866_cov_31.319461_g3755_i0:72-464(-)